MTNQLSIPNQPDLRSLTLEFLIVNPAAGLVHFQENTRSFSDALFEQFPEINSKVLRVLLLQLPDLRKLWDLRSTPDLPDWYFHVDRVPLENLLIGLEHDLPVSPDGNLILWWQIHQPLNHDLLDALIHKGVDLNQINEAEGLTLLQKAILIPHEENVNILLRHQVNPDSKAVSLAFESNYRLSTGTTLRIIRSLRVYGAQIPTDFITNADVQRYLRAAEMMHPEYCAGYPWLNLDREEDLSLQAIVDPSLLDDPAFQNALGPIRLETFRKAVALKRSLVTVTESGQVLTWPWYQNEVLNQPEFCEVTSKGVTVTPLPEATQVYQKALSGLPNLPKCLRSQNTSRSQVISPTNYYPEETTTPLPE